MKYKEENEDFKENKNKFKKMFLYSLIPICVIICFITGCLTSETSKFEQPSPKKESAQIKSHNYKRFVDTWNGTVYEIKDNIDLERTIENTDKYLVKNDYSDISQKLKALLDFSDRPFIAELKTLQNIKFSKSLYLAVIEWIKARNRIKYLKLTSTMDSSKLSQKIATMVDNEYFSASTVDKIVQLNDFCYFFEKNKLSLYRDGMSKGITKCTQIKSNLLRHQIIIK